MNQNRRPDSIKTEPIWNNRHILYKGSPLFFVARYKARLLYIQDLWINDRRISFEEAKHFEYNGNLQLEYSALINAIPGSWKQEMNDNSTQIETPKEITTEIGTLSKHSNTTIRGPFDKKINHEICAVRFWKRKCKHWRLFHPNFWMSQRNQT